MKIIVCQLVTISIFTPNPVSIDPLHELLGGAVTGALGELLIHFWNRNMHHNILLILNKTYFYLCKSQMDVNTMVKHYKTFDEYFLRRRAWGIPNRSSYTPGRNSYGTPRGVTAPQEVAQQVIFGMNTSTWKHKNGH